MLCWMDLEWLEWLERPESRSNWEYQKSGTTWQLEQTCKLEQPESWQDRNNSYQECAAPLYRLLIWLQRAETKKYFFQDSSQIIKL